MVNFTKRFLNPLSYTDSDFHGAFAHYFGGGSTPPPKAPAAPAPAPLAPEDQPVRARQEIQQRERRKSGLASTMLTTSTNRTILGSPITQ